MLGAVAVFAVTVSIDFGSTATTDLYGEVVDAAQYQGGNNSEVVGVLII